MTQCISALCVLGIVNLAVLIMTGAISIEHAGNAIGRAFVLLVVALWAICILQGTLAAAGPVLKSLTLWTAIAVIVIIAIALFIRAMISNSQKRVPPRDNHGRGDL
jgi:hypothetical protein